MNERVQHLSLAGQIAAVERARAIVVGVARVPPRAAERDYYATELDAALRTLRWLRAHEGEIRSAILPKQSAPAPDSGEAPKPDGNPRAVGLAPSERGEERRRWSELPLATQAGVRCNEAAFQKFLSVSSAEAAAQTVRVRCGVESRSGLDKCESAAKSWREIEAKYRAWLSDPDLASGCAGAERATETSSGCAGAERAAEAASGRAGPERAEEDNAGAERAERRS
jgi:hypothetical protein